MHPTILESEKAAPRLIGVPQPSQQDFAQFLRRRVADLDDLIARLVSGDLSVQEWYAEVYELLRSGHAGGRALGRQRAGDLTAIGIDDFLAGRAIADNESEFLLRFADDLASHDRRYWDDDLGAYRPQQIANRGRLYVQKMRGTAGQAFVSAHPDEAEFNWVMGAAEHCDECPVLAAKSPWLGGELFTTPGNGDTPCRSNCKCHLVRKSDGLTSFKPVSLQP
jgi:hypothetical protein